MEPFDLRFWSNCPEELKRQPSIIDQITIDSRRIGSSASLFVALKGEGEDGHAFVPHAATMGAKFALVKAGYKPSISLGSLILIFVPDPLRALQEIASSYRQSLQTPVLALIGSYGKTMAKDLLHAILNRHIQTFASPESFNSQIGVPLSLLRMKKTDRIALIEGGISQPGEMKILAETIMPNFGLITKIAETHLATLKDLPTIAGEMSSLAKKLPTNGWMLLPSNEELRPHLSEISARKIFWDGSDPALPQIQWNRKISGKYEILFPDGRRFENHLKWGRHYLLEIIQMCVKTAWLFEVPSSTICEALEEYTPEVMQKEVWLSPQGALFINDVYSADPLSIGKALRSLPKEGRRIFLFGGLRGNHSDEIAPLRTIAQEMEKAKIDQLILVGKRDFSSLIKAVTEFSPKTEISLFTLKQEAFHQMRRRLRQGDTVLIKGSQKDSLEIIASELTDVMGDNRLTIQLGKIRSNVQLLRTQFRVGTRIMAMVKAQAYGTDAIFLGKFLKNCGIDILGVAHVDEGICLRAAGVTQSIFVINAPLYEVSKLVQYGFEVGVSEGLLCQAIHQEAEKQNKKIKVHLHVDTGMSRLGCRPEEALALAKSIHGLSSLELEGFMTHFAAAENAKEDPFTLQQIAVFKNLLEKLHEEGIFPRWIHAANSSASLRFDLPFCTMVRIGLALFGLFSSPDEKKILKLKSALSLKSKIAGINLCKKGDSISYGRTYVVQKEEEKIGVIPLGYFDGLHRHYSGRGYVLIRGQRAPKVGTICMDFMMVDITEIPDVEVGDPVFLFGEDELGNTLEPEEVASWVKTDIRELITCLGPRIQRLFVDDEK